MIFLIRILFPLTPINRQKRMNHFMKQYPSPSFKLHPTMFFDIIFIHFYIDDDDGGVDTPEYSFVIYAWTCGVDVFCYSEFGCCFCRRC